MKQLSELANKWFQICYENGINPLVDEGFDFESWLADNRITYQFRRIV